MLGCHGNIQQLVKELNNVPFMLARNECCHQLGHGAHEAVEHINKAHPRCSIALV